MESVIRKFEVVQELTLSLAGENKVFPVGSIIAEGLISLDELKNLEGNGMLTEVIDHVVTEEDIAANPDAGLVLGETIQLPVPVAADDSVDEDEEEEEQAPEVAVQESPVAQSGAGVAPSGTPYVYAGKKVIRDTTREVNGHELHHIQLESGESLDITDADYEAMVEASKVV